MVILLFLLTNWIASAVQRDHDVELESSVASVADSVSRLQETATRIEEVQRSADATNHAYDIGISAAFAGRIIPNESEYLRRFLAATRQFDIIGLDLSSVTRRFEDYYSKFNLGLRFRILLLDPDFPDRGYSYISQRHAEEGQSSPAMSGAELYCRRFAKWRATLDPDIAKSLDHEIRLYRTLPSLHYVRYDDEIIFGPYLIGKSSEHTFTLVSHTDSAIFGQLSAHFDAIWDQWSSKPPAAWLEPSVEPEDA